MKHRLSFFTAILMTICVSAQTSKKRSEHQEILNALLQPQMIAGTQKMVLSERVKAQSTWDNLMASKSDSVYLNYPMNGISNYDFNMMLFPYNYPYSTTPVFNNCLGTFTKPQVYYSSHDHWTVDPNTLVYGFYERDLAAYDANFNLIRDTALFADSAMYPNMRYVNTFNAANNVDSSHSYVWSSGASANSFKQLFSYNASNKITKDSTYEFAGATWHKVAKTVYTYDVPGNLVQIDNYSNNADSTFTMPLIEQLKYVNTYDGSGRLKTVQSSYYDGTMLKPYVTDSFAYTGTASFHLSWKEYQYDAINSYWTPMTFMHKTLGGSGFPDVVNIDAFDSLANAWTPYYKWMITYNGFNDPVKLDEFIYNFGSFPSAPDFTTHYYYETFTNTTGVADRDLSDVSVYPNPAKDVINISGLENNTGVITLTFYDGPGRMLFKEETYANAGTVKISTGDLSPGIYLLNISGASGKRIAAKKIIISK
ncbi:MAG: T9SS type A sorting domain-containing protein [Bacteroidia bacterium]